MMLIHPHFNYEHLQNRLGHLSLCVLLHANTHTLTQTHKLTHTWHRSAWHLRSILTTRSLLQSRCKSPIYVGGQNITLFCLYSSKALMQKGFCSPSLLTIGNKVTLNLHQSMLLGNWEWRPTSYNYPNLHLSCLREASSLYSPKSFAVRWLKISCLAYALFHSICALHLTGR